MTLTDRRPAETTGAMGAEGRRASMPHIVGGGVLLFVGVLWLLERTGAIDISVTAVLALATMVVGISLMLLAREGRHAGLVVLGTLLALVTMVTVAAPFEGFQGGVGDRTIEVTSVDDLVADYNLAMGKLTIDLRDVDGLMASTPVSASVGMGELLIRIPKGTAIEVEASVGAGQIDILGRTTDGVDIEQTFVSPSFAESSQSISLDLSAFTGRVEVTDE